MTRSECSDTSARCLRACDGALGSVGRNYNELPVGPVLRLKQQKLFDLLADMDKVLVAYSGGTDSAYLAWAANRVLGTQALAVTADSASIPESHKRDAIDFAVQFGIAHRMIQTQEFENPEYTQNDANRCFHCKDELFNRMNEVGEELGVSTIAYGVNADDTSDFRPGHRAARKHEVRAPLLEADLAKAEIRELSREAGLPTWDRPAAACLSSRIPYGTQVTPENVRQVERGEEALGRLGFRVFRVRHHGSLARIEVGKDELPRALSLDMAETLAETFREIGYQYVTLDLAGYRQGSLNEVLQAGPDGAFRILD